MGPEQDNRHEAASETPQERGGQIDIEARKAIHDVEEASLESFPASDPPSWTPTAALGPPSERQAEA